MKIVETPLNEEIEKILIALSEDWEKEDCTYGYHKNAHSDLEGQRIFLAYEEEEVIGYLFGERVIADQDTSFYKKDEPYFCVNEIYVKPAYRSKGIGKELFAYLKSHLTDEKYIAVPTATKDYKRILHFYIEEIGLEFWSAYLCQKLR